MPQRSESNHHPRHSGQAARSSVARNASASAPSAAARAGYTLAHGARQVRLGPVAFWIAVGTLVIMAGWTVTTATYFAFREDVLTRLITREAEMQWSYEDRIADLRAQVDRISSRQLLDQEQYDQKLDQIARRQSTLELRASALNALPEATITGSIRRSGPAGEPLRPTPYKPSPINDSGRGFVPGNRGASLAVSPHTSVQAGGLGNALKTLQTSLDRVEARQMATLNTLQQGYDAKVRLLGGVLAEVGVNPSRIASPGTMTRGTGGPFVPVRPTAGSDNFERQITRITLARAQIDRLTRTLNAVPVRRPVEGEIDLTSTFGVRVDPFVGRPAMHTGLDFRGETGEPIHATAAGTVTSAGWSGGYGKMVEVDHGNGFVTRYGHMSEIDAKVGQPVKIGQVLGRIGSTGRSTGPHLHYETRVSREAVDPQKFLRAGAKLAGAL